MRRITKADLETLVRSINEITESPTESWARNKAGKLVACIGNYHLDSAYGGHRLVRHMTEGGGIVTITNGFVSKRELYELMQSYKGGLLDAKVSL